jgi:hypothetical protein
MPVKEGQPIQIDAIDRDIESSALFHPGQELLADRVIGLPRAWHPFIQFDHRRLLRYTQIHSAKITVQA